jgi:N-acetylglutamate synthase-like GNAT family acetyltransferase
MQIIPYQNGLETQVSEVIKEALDKHKYDFQGCDFALIEHDKRVYSPEYIREYAKKAELFLAINGAKRILGVAALENNELNTCYTRGDQQKRGVGKSLVNHIIKLAKERGLTTLKVIGNFYTRGFYESCGFTFIEETHVNFEGAKWPVVHLEMNLV